MASMLGTTCILQAVLLVTIAGTAAAQTTWSRVGSFRFDWNGRSKVKVILEHPEPWNHFGDFTRIRILVPGEKPFVLNTDSAWENFREDAANISPQMLKRKNLVPSNYVLAADASSDARTVLILFGYAVASSPGSLDVIELPLTGGPRVVLHRNELGLRTLTDLDSDGLAELVTFPCVSQTWGNDLLTYDPYNIYKLGIGPGEKAQISIPLSQSYNLAHYYGWAGINCSEKLAVVQHPPGGGKPKIMPAERAEALMTHHSSDSNQKLKH